MSNGNFDYQAMAEAFGGVLRDQDDRRSTAEESYSPIYKMTQAVEKSLMNL